MGYEQLVRYGLWALLILGVAGTIWWAAATIHDNIYDDGVHAERVIWQEKEARESAERAAKIQELETRAVTAEKAHEERVATIDAKHTKELEDANKQKADDIAAARAGAIKLRWPGQDTGGRGNGGVAAGTIAVTAGQCNDTTGGELPGSVAANLLSLANDADRNTEQLTACQAVVLSDREM